MRALISFIMASLFIYLGYYVYTHLSKEEQQKVLDMGKKGVDKVGDAVTNGAKAVLKQVDSSTPASAPAPANK